MLIVLADKRNSNQVQEDKWGGGGGRSHALSRASKHPNYMVVMRTVHVLIKCMKVMPALPFSGITHTVTVNVTTMQMTVYNIAIKTRAGQLIKFDLSFTSSQ